MPTSHEPHATNLGLTDLEPALDTLVALAALAAALRHDHPAELDAWALMYLANELGLHDVTVVGVPDDPLLTAGKHLEVAEAALWGGGRPYLGAFEHS